MSGFKKLWLLLYWNETCWTYVVLIRFTFVSKEYNKKLRSPDTNYKSSEVATMSGFTAVANIPNNI